MAVKPLSFRWEDDFVAKIDEARGTASRSAFVRTAVERHIDFEAFAQATLARYQQALADWRAIGQLSTSLLEAAHSDLETKRAMLGRLQTELEHDAAERN